MLAAVLAGSTVARDERVGRDISQIPAADRSVRADWFGLPAQAREDWPTLDRRGSPGAPGSRRRRAGIPRPLSGELARRPLHRARGRRQPSRLGRPPLRAPPAAVPPRALRGRPPSGGGPPPERARPAARRGRGGRASLPRPLRRLPRPGRERAQPRRPEPALPGGGGLPSPAARTARARRRSRPAHALPGARERLQELLVGRAAPAGERARVGAGPPRRGGCPRPLLVAVGLGRVRPRCAARRASRGRCGERGGGTPAAPHRRRGGGAALRLRRPRGRGHAQRRGRREAAPHVVRRARLAAQRARRRGNRADRARRHGGRLGARLARRLARGRPCRGACGRRAVALDVLEPGPSCRARDCRRARARPPRCAAHSTGGARRSLLLPARRRRSRRARRDRRAARPWGLRRDLARGRGRLGRCARAAPRARHFRRRGSSSHASSARRCSRSSGLRAAATSRFAWRRSPSPGTRAMQPWRSPSWSSASGSPSSPRATARRWPAGSSRKPPSACHSTSSSART